MQDGQCDRIGPGPDEVAGRGLWHVGQPCIANCSLYHRLLQFANWNDDAAGRLSLAGLYARSGAAGARTGRLASARTAVLRMVAGRLKEKSKSRFLRLSQLEL